MKNVFWFVIVSIFLFACSIEENENSDSINAVLEYSYFDLTSDQEPWFRQNRLIKDDTLANMRASLGRRLFYDTQLSINHTTSCASCHQQINSFTQNKKQSPGHFNSLSTRNSMSLVNTGFQNYYFWDIRHTRNNFNTAVLSPITNAKEMGFSSLDDLVLRLQDDEKYDHLFALAYGENQLNEKNIGTSLATFVSSLISFNSAFDKGSEIDFDNYTSSEKRGKDLFFDKAKCSNCHNGINFTDGWVANIGLDKHITDEGWHNGQFKTPSLRNVELTAPYMHDGRFATLEEVVTFYNSEVQENEFLSWQLAKANKKPIRLGLSESEKVDLVTFLKTLTDWDFIYDPKYSNPFD